MPIFIIFICIYFSVPSALAQSFDREYTNDGADCKILTDALQNGNMEIVSHKINIMLAWIDKLNSYEKEKGRPTFDLTSTMEKRKYLFNQVYMQCIQNPYGEVSDKTVTVYKFYAGLSGYTVPNN